LKPKRLRWLVFVALTVVMQGCGGGGAAGTAPPLSPTSSAIQVAPASLNLAGAGSANAKTVSASENFYTGALTESDTCNPSAGTIASVAPVSGIAPVTFTVTPRTPGNCSITISDTNSQSALVSVNDSAPSEKTSAVRMK